MPEAAANFVGTLLVSADLFENEIQTHGANRLCHRPSQAHSPALEASCPNEATAAVAAKHLKKAGFKKIRPLLGGTEAWTKAGRKLVIVAENKLLSAA
jgi:hypothetical protein